MLQLKIIIKIRMLIIGPSGSGKTNSLLNLIQQDNNIIDTETEIVQENLILF